jgi:pimeloyl-ACP methyl ester carboxylesterase
MKVLQICWLILVFCTSACVNGTPARSDDSVRDSGIAAGLSPSVLFEAGKVTDSVICRSDPSQSYALYIPKKGNRAALPIIYFFDPHGAGALPLNKYKSLADTYGFMMIGSNNSRNGNDWTATESIWQRLSEDTKGRLKIDSSRIYTGGFSGGAKVASYIALQHPGIKGVIANCAGLPDGTQAGDFPFSFTSIAGEGDMNLTDLIALSNGLDNTRTRHRIIFFDGKHEWAPEHSMNIAFEGFQFDAMQQALIPADEALIGRYIAESKKRLDTCYQQNQLIKAGQECVLSISLLDGLTHEVNWFREKAASLTKDPEYHQQRLAQETLLVKEQGLKAEYMQHFQQGDIQYWNNIIQDLQTKAGAKRPDPAMYQRLIAYLSLAFYSISNQLINNNRNGEALQYVALYKMADPGNPEAWYFSAILNARDGHAQAAADDLQKAAGLGFKDMGRIRQQPEFQNLSPKIDFSRIEREMRLHGKAD